MWKDIENLEIRKKHIGEEYKTESVPQITESKIWKVNAVKQCEIAIGKLENDTKVKEEKVEIVIQSEE